MNVEMRCVMAACICTASLVKAPLLRSQNLLQKRQTIKKRPMTMMTSTCLLKTSRTSSLRRRPPSQMLPRIQEQRRLVQLAEVVFWRETTRRATTRSGRVKFWMAAIRFPQPWVGVCSLVSPVPLISSPKRLSPSRSCGTTMPYVKAATLRSPSCRSSTRRIRRTRSTLSGSNGLSSTRAIFVWRSRT